MNDNYQKRDPTLVSKFNQYCEENDLALRMEPDEWLTALCVSKYCNQILERSDKKIQKANPKRIVTIAEVFFKMGKHSPFKLHP